MRKLMAILVVGSTLLLLLGLVGCEGLSGPRGETGDTGTTGPGYEPPVPANRYFALGVTNAASTDHNGAPRLYLSFDGAHQNAGDTVVCIFLPEGQVPAIDGVDGGVDEWGDMATTVAMRKVAGQDNLIDSARVKAAYDSDYIYFQVQWTEVEDASLGLEASESNQSMYWMRHPDSTNTAAAWISVDNQEDRLLMMFEVTPMAWFDHEGCYITCHAAANETNLHRTILSGERMDMWAWSAAKSNPLGYAKDYTIDNSPVLASSWDAGLPPYEENTQSIRINDILYDLPLYQHSSDPNANSPDPFWDWAVANFNRALSWQGGATIPGYVLHVPTASNADVLAQGKFISGTWTVELKRARHTGNGDDAEF